MVVRRVGGGRCSWALRFADIVFQDARAIGPNESIETDLCVVGAGAAGITLARAWSGRPYRVLVLESGGLEPDPSIQALADGTIVGRPYFPLQSTRLRYFGGTTNHWAAFCRP